MNRKMIEAAGVDVSSPLSMPGGPLSLRGVDSAKLAGVCPNVVTSGTSSLTQAEIDALLAELEQLQNTNNTLETQLAVMQNTIKTVYYVHDGDRIVEERDDQDHLVASYVYGNGIDEVVEMTRFGERYYYHLNTLGTVYALTDNTGTVVERYEYDAYGKVTIYDETMTVARTYSLVGNIFTFTGRQLDYETGLYYYRARMYDPETGRFLSHDPLGYIDGMGLYEYLKGNPLNYTDPFGLYADKEFRDMCKEEQSKPSPTDANIPERIFAGVEGIGEEVYNLGASVASGAYSALTFGAAVLNNGVNLLVCVPQAVIPGQYYIPFPNSAQRISNFNRGINEAGSAMSDVVITMFGNAMFTYTGSERWAKDAQTVQKVRAELQGAIDEMLVVFKSLPERERAKISAKLVVALGSLAIPGSKIGSLGKWNKADWLTFLRNDAKIKKVIDEAKAIPPNKEAVNITIEKKSTATPPIGATTKSPPIRGTSSAPIKSPPSINDLSRAANAIDREGYTVAGRSLTKHGAGARTGNSLFPQAKGNPSAINKQAQNIVDDILTTPGLTIQNSYRGRFGSTIEVTAPDGRGIVYDANGKFLFFKEGK